MADDINSSASFGQSKNDSEELPIIVAQRFLNIFRQLHIFSDERREAFNKMLLELPPEVKSIFQSLPGGTPLQEYMEDLEQKSKGLEPVAHHSHQKNSNILQEALSENRSTGGTTGGEGIINGDNFARILASSLAQSNAEIIRELQNTRPAAAGIEGGSGTGGGFDGPMKLVADESFTNIISKALAEAIENSEKKRLEDNKMIARSFTELQENLTKLIEQSSQLKFISGGDGKTAAAPIQMKGLVDDLVKAQSAFLKETTKSQKEELSSIISTAIKESQKVSTQALIESFKKISEEKIPTPITYAASSPKGQPAMESVEQALKAQGKEFSSIISMALKESQKNSAQTIIETLETLKKDSTVSAGGQNNLKVEEIMRMQANLFRDIARAQNQEFSALISSALKESQRQSTEAIIAALSQLQTAPVQTVAVPMPAVNREIPAALQPAVHERPAAPQMPEPTVSTPMIDKYLDGVDKEEETEEKANAAVIEETPKKKKKKKKKKNREAENGTTGTVDDESDEMPAGEEKTQQETKTETPAAGGAEKEKAPAESKVSAPAAGETPKAAEAGKPAAGETPAGKPEKENQNAAREAATEKTTEEKAQPAEEKAKPAESAPKADKTATSKPEPAAAAEEGKEPQISPMLRKLMTISTAFADVQDIKDSDPGDDWGWGFGGSDSQKTDNAAGGSDGYGFETDDDGYSAAATADAGDGEDWEWEYEEVPADAEMSGEEGEDWEWEYEEVPADAETSGEEGEDWEWEYEEVPADAETAGEENGDWEWEYENTPAAAAETEDEVYEEAAAEDSSLSPDEFAQTSEIVVDSLPQFVLLGLEDEKFRDPYIENSDNIG